MVGWQRKGSDMQLWIAIILTCVLSVPAAAARKAKAGDTATPQAELRIEGSFVQKAGNTDKIDYTYGGSLKLSWMDHVVTAGVRGDVSERKNQAKDVDSFRADIMESWRLTPTIQPYAKLTYYRNPVWGFRHQARVGFGLVQGWWDTTSGHVFTTRAGYQFRANEFTALWGQSEGPKPEERQHCLLLGARTQLPLMKNITLSLTGDYEPVLLGGDNYYADLEGSLSFTVNQRVSIVTGHSVIYQRVPIPGKARSNTESAVRFSVRL